MELTQRQYPIGKWQPKNSYTWKQINSNIATIASYPAKYKRLTRNLGEQDLEKTYREGAWNIRQLVVHISDMHILHFARFKQALCVDNPIGFLADINGWNNLAETQTASVADALLLLEATHKRWVHLLRTMSEADFQRTFFHPLRNAELTLAQALAMAAWHSKHHFEHIKIALNN